MWEWLIWPLATVPAFASLPAIPLHPSLSLPCIPHLAQPMLVLRRPPAGPIPRLRQLRPGSGLTRGRPPQPRAAACAGRDPEASARAPRPAPCPAPLLPPRPPPLIPLPRAGASWSECRLPRVLGQRSPRPGVPGPAPGRAARCPRTAFSGRPRLRRAGCCCGTASDSRGPRQRPLPRCSAAGSAGQTPSPCSRGRRLRGPRRRAATALAGRPAAGARAPRAAPRSRYAPARCEINSTRVSWLPRRTRS
jgi:hypothetical protein